jgi:hypothetical protein
MRSCGRGGVDRDRYPVRYGIAISASQQAAHPTGIVVTCPDSDVERVVVIDDRERGRDARGVARAREALREPAIVVGVAPVVVAEVAIDRDRGCASRRLAADDCPGFELAVRRRGDGLGRRRQRDRLGMADLNAAEQCNRTQRSRVAQSVAGRPKPEVRNTRGTEHKPHTNE